MPPSPSSLQTTRHAPDTDNPSNDAGYLLEDGTEKTVGDTPNGNVSSAHGDDYTHEYANGPRGFKDYLKMLGQLGRLQFPRILPSSMLRHAAYGLIPSFVQSRLRGERTTSESAYSTAHLDGVRGVAAFFVFIGHMSYVSFPILVGYASGDPGEFTNILLLPIIRLIYSGAAAVAVFFVISGYALSVKPLKLMRSQSYDKLLTTASSAAFRRAFRLFLPCIASTFLILLLVQLGLYEITRGIAYDKTLLRWFQESHKVRRATFTRQFQDWYRGMSRFFWVWNFGEVYGGSIDYDLHLWTIPLEFRASLVLFLTHIALARMRVKARVFITLLLVWFALRWGRWEMCLFWSGFLLAEYDLDQAVKASANEAQQPLNSTDRRKGKFWHCIYVSCFICSLYLLSYPDQGAAATPGFATLESMVPRAIRIEEPIRFWTSIGAIMLIWSINSVKYLANLFNRPLIQYLGKISYALYLMHGPVMHTWGYSCMMVFWSIFGTDTEFGYKIGYACSVCCIIPVAIWAADVFWRAIDIPSVKFARWLEMKLVVDP